MDQWPCLWDTAARSIIIRSLKLILCIPPPKITILPPYSSALQLSLALGTFRQLSQLISARSSLLAALPMVSMMELVSISKVEVRLRLSPSCGPSSSVRRGFLLVFLTSPCFRLFSQRSLQQFASLSWLRYFPGDWQLFSASLFSFSQHSTPNFFTESLRDFFTTGLCSSLILARYYCESAQQVVTILLAGSMAMRSFRSWVTPLVPPKMNSLSQNTTPLCPNLPGRGFTREILEYLHVRRSNFQRSSKIVPKSLPPQMQTLFPMRLKDPCALGLGYSLCLMFLGAKRQRHSRVGRCSSSILALQSPSVYPIPTIILSPYRQALCESIAGGTPLLTSFFHSLRLQSNLCRSLVLSITLLMPPNRYSPSPQATVEWECLGPGTAPSCSTSLHAPSAKEKATISYSTLGELLSYPPQTQRVEL